MLVCGTACRDLSPVGQFEAANGVRGAGKLLESTVVSTMNDGSLSCSNKTEQHSPSQHPVILTCRFPNSCRHLRSPREADHVLLNCQRQTWRHSRASRQKWTHSSPCRQSGACCQSIRTKMSIASFCSSSGRKASHTRPRPSASSSRAAEASPQTATRILQR